MNVKKFDFQKITDLVLHYSSQDLFMGLCEEVMSKENEPTEQSNLTKKIKTGQRSRCLDIAT